MTRIAEPMRITARFLRDTTWLLTVAMGVFAFGLAIELIVITTVALGSLRGGVFAGIAALLMFILLWFVLPWSKRKTA